MRSSRTTCGSQLATGMVGMAFLVGGWAQTLWKIWQLVSWDHDIPNIRKNKNCSKPPTSDYIWGLLGIIPLDLNHDSMLRSRREVVICPDDKIQLLINLTPECSLRITIPFLGWKKMKWPNSRVAKDVVDVMIVMTIMSQCFHFFWMSVIGCEHDMTQNWLLQMLLVKSVFNPNPQMGESSTLLASYIAIITINPRP